MDGVPRRGLGWRHHFLQQPLLVLGRRPGPGLQRAVPLAHSAYQGCEAQGTPLPTASPLANSSLFRALMPESLP